MAETKKPTTRKSTPATIDRLLDTLAETKEGKALVDFARASKVRFEHRYDKTNTGLWRPRDNTLFLNKALKREEALISLAHELRHAWQTHSVKNLDRVTDRNLLRTKFKDSVIMLRAMEADAYSYQLSTAVELHKKGIIRQRPEKAFMTMESEPAIEKFLKGFMKKHGAQPFSAKARRESFEFFHDTALFYHEYDSIYAGMGANASRRALGEIDLDYASLMQLPTLGKAFNAFGQSKVSDPKSKYMSAGDRHDVARLTVASLNPAVRKIITRVDKRLHDLHKTTVRKDYDPKKLLRMAKRS